MCSILVNNGVLVHVPTYSTSWTIVVSNWYRPLCIIGIYIYTHIAGLRTSVNQQHLGQLSIATSRDNLATISEGYATAGLRSSTNQHHLGWLSVATPRDNLVAISEGQREAD